MHDDAAKENWNDDVMAMTATMVLMMMMVMMMVMLMVLALALVMTVVGNTISPLRMMQSAAALPGPHIGGPGRGVHSLAHATPPNSNMGHLCIFTH